MEKTFLENIFLKNFSKFQLKAIEFIEKYSPIFKNLLENYYFLELSCMYMHWGLG